MTEPIRNKQINTEFFNLKYDMFVSVCLHNKLNPTLEYKKILCCDFENATKWTENVS